MEPGNFVLMVFAVLVGVVQLALSVLGGLVILVALLAVIKAAWQSPD